MSVRAVRASPTSPETRPDLRLLAPTLAAWVTSLVSFRLSVWAACTVAAAAATCAVLAVVACAREDAVRRAASRLRAECSRRSRRHAFVRRAVESATAVPGTRVPRPRPRSHGRSRFRRVAAVVVATSACSAAAAAGVGLRMSAVGSGPVRALAVDEATVVLGAVVTGDPRTSTDPGSPRGRRTVVVSLRVETVRARGRTERVRVPALGLATAPGWSDLLPSQHVRLTGRLDMPRGGELLAAVVFVHGSPRAVTPPSTLQHIAGVVRARLRTATDALPPDQRGILPGLVDGDTSRLPPEVAEDFRATGLTHLLAVSGGNLAIVLGAVLGLVRFVGLGGRITVIVGGVAVFGFVVVARPEPSVLRAAVMGAITLAALATGRERRGVPALCAAVLVLVLVDPELARSYGFVLSALATAGILVIAPTWRKALGRRLPRVIADPLAVAAAAQVVCDPVLVMISGRLSVLSVPANLLAGPAVAPATLLGVLAALVAPVSLPLARLIVIPAGFAVGWVAGVARVLARVPYATLPWRAGAVGGLLLLLVVLAVVVVARRRFGRRILAVALVGVIVGVVAIRVVGHGWPPRGWLLVACDVGQGDGLVLSAGSRGAVVVDTGPDPVLMDRCLRGLGVRSVPLMILTHPHADHIDGVPGVLRGRSVGKILISPDSAGEERRLLPGRPVRPAVVGDVWTVGPVTLTVLGPLPGVTRDHVGQGDDGTTVNNASVVVLARWPGMTALLTGDIEPEAQAALLSASIPDVDVLKIPHHGSSHQDPAFLAAAHARIAITSVGADNDYGQPAPTTTALVARLGMRAYRTDRDGTIAVLRDHGELTVVTRKERTD